MDRTLQRLRRAFSDISKGHSFIKDGEDEFYIKHLSHHDQVDLDSIYDLHYSSARRKGVPTDDEKLKFLIEVEESWTKKDEEELISLEETIRSMNDGRKNLILEKQIKKHNEEIEELKIKFNKKSQDKSSLMGMTCESFAESRSNEYYIIESFFLDEGFKVRAINTRLEDSMDEDVNRLSVLYSDVAQTLSDDSLKKLSVQDFFQIYWSMCDNDGTKFFGRPIVDLTYNQIRLAGYAKMFRKLFQDHPNMPDSVREDPDKVIDYANSATNAANEAQKTNGESVTLVGGTDEDYEKLGVNMDNVVKPSDILKKSGKKQLSMQELMELEGFKPS